MRVTRDDLVFRLGVMGAVVRASRTGERVRISCLGHLDARSDMEVFRLTLQEDIADEGAFGREIETADEAWMRQSVWGDIRLLSTALAKPIEVWADGVHLYTYFQGVLSLLSFSSGVS